jgi:hypothetical protein
VERRERDGDGRGDVEGAIVLVEVEGGPPAGGASRKHTQRRECARVDGQHSWLQEHKNQRSGNHM